jgi:membrane fusion protein, multidrug efflux system
MMFRFCLLALSSLSLLAGCDVRTSNAQSAPAPEPVVSVATTQATIRTLPRTLSLTGTLTANRESAVAADVSGKVVETYVERGSRVRAGAPLVRLDRRQAALMAEEARSQVAAAQTQAALAKSECARADNLFDNGAINQAERDRAKAQCEGSALNAAAARARGRLAGKNLGDLLIKAPFAGVVADRQVNPGEYVRPDSKVASVVQLHPLRLELSVPESSLAALAVGAEVKFRVAAWPDETFTGRVRFVGATVRRATRDLLVEAVVPNETERLRPGMFAVAEIELGDVALPVIPRSAVRSDERAGNDRVFVVQDGRLEERLVHLGPSAGDLVGVQAGLSTSERVVLRPSAALRDGLRVQ